MITHRCATLLGVVLPAIGAASLHAQVTGVERVSQVNLGTTTVDQNGLSFTVAGLSGIRLRPASQTDYIAVMDNSNKLVYIRILLAANGSITSATFTGGLTLAETRDFEAIDIAPDGTSVLLAEEGTPAIHEYSLTSGARLRTITPPPIYSQRRANFGIESLTASADASHLWFANEEALTTDGSLSTTSVGTLVRIQQCGLAAGSYAPQRQWAYQCNPIHGSLVSGARSGLCELLHIPQLQGSDPLAHLLVLERSLAFSASGFFQSRLYRIEAAGATDTSNLPSLTGATTVRKTLLWSGSVNNMEGLALGPQLSPDSLALIGVIDDGDPISINALVSFRLGFVACPADFNGDGGIDGNDIDAFFAAWEQGNADVNADGGVDGADVSAFFTVWEAGGCS
ncbi:MAG: esterase-like activity of phytase family protein [Planctomycetota bacterium]|nr:esterase-like activity of phytase family protein [Planctomycetota bacterium]